MNTFKKLATLAAISFSAASFSATAADSYAVAAQISHHGKVFASPSVVVKRGVPATVKVGGGDGYTLSLTVTDIAPDKINVAAKLNSSYGTMTPTVVVRPSQPATVTVGDMGLTLTVNRSGS